MAYVDASGKPEIIPNAEGERLTPSVVYYDGCSTIVGQPAKDAGIAHPEFMAQMFKPEMATDWVCSIKGRRFTPVELSATVLAKLKRDAEAYLKTTISHAVVTVPANFYDPQRRLTEIGQSSWPEGARTAK